MDESEFKPGDVVKLRSNNPEMTVSNIDRETTHSVFCVWFDNKTVCRDSFTPTSLMLARKES